MRKATPSWTKGFPYYEIAERESIIHQGIGGETRIELLATNDRAVELTVDGSPVNIPLGHFSPTTADLPRNDVLNLVELNGVRIGADATRDLLDGSRYTRTLLNLQGDARLFLCEAGMPISPPGTHVFPLANYRWNYADNWLNPVTYGRHLGIDLNAERGHPILNVSDGRVAAIHCADDPAVEDYWGNNLGILGDDGVLYCYMHWDTLAPNIAENVRVRAGDPIALLGRSGFESKRIASHLHFEMMLLLQPERFFFAYELEPAVLPTPNRVLQPEVEGHVINPYPYLVEWYLRNSKCGP